MKASQDTYIPLSIIKENADIFANFHYCKFSKSFKNANVLPIYKKD